MNVDYESLAADVRSAGYFADVRKDCLVCSSLGGENWMGGISFRVGHVGNEWQISTWSSHSYQVPATSSLISLITQILKCSDPYLHRLPDEIVRDFELTEL